MIDLKAPATFERSAVAPAARATGTPPAAPEDRELRDPQGSPLLGEQRSRRKIGKIPPELRKRRIRYQEEPSWLRRLLLRLREDSQTLRSTVQLAFALLCVWIGVEFYYFVRWGMSGGLEGFVPRPPGAEGFLPISGLISLKYYLQTGVINTIHPAALVILLAIIVVSFVVRKAFCSWLCPVGTLSESLWSLGNRIFGRNLTLPRWIDIPLRSLKYLLLGFFLWSIWTMDTDGLAAFIGSPYNKVADIKMYLFFARISGFALGVLLLLALLSVIIKNFWCRFLCPYGALLGILGWLSPFKITREKSTCVDCELCTKACPAHINVHTATRVWSDECMSCLRCIDVCPVEDTLLMRTRSSASRIPGWVFGVLIGGVFMAVTGLAMITGHWQNGITPEEYQRRLPAIESPIYQHFQGQVPAYDENE